MKQKKVDERARMAVFLPGRMQMSSSNNSAPPINQNWLDQIPGEIIDSFLSDDPPIIFLGSGFGKEAIPPLRTGGELASLIREELGLEDNGEGLAEYLQYLENEMAGSKARVIDWLKEKLLYLQSEPGGAYRLLLELPSNKFLTTNYDSLLKKASGQINYNLITFDDPMNIRSANQDVQKAKRSGWLGRLHGSFESQEKLVATTNDYNLWYTETGKKWEDYFQEQIRNKRIIFIGYSLRDFTINTSFISVIAKWKDHVYPHALVSPTRNKHLDPFWRNYNIRYIPLTGYQFLITIHDQMGNLDKREDVRLAAAAACMGKSYEETLEAAEKVMKDNYYSSLKTAAIKIIMDGCHGD